MTETITSIEQFDNDTIETGETFSDGTPWGISIAGFKVKTTGQEIVLGIDNQQDCCEDWGYFLTEDETEKFVGAELLGVEITDPDLSHRKLPDYGLDEGEAMFVNVKTSRGTLQFVAYNAHNGYYGHRAVVKSTQLNHEVVL